jgi:hypothetical protein
LQKPIMQEKSMRGGIFCLLVTGCILTGCDRHDAASGAGPKSPGRYAGIGIFQPGRLWQQTAGVPPSKDPAAATLNDDEHVIVVIDSHTGEVRQCGDHSGFCVAMNPWTGAGAPATAPVKLAKHEADLVVDDQAASDETNTAATSAPAR